jgi:hypothetical protein
MHLLVIYSPNKFSSLDTVEREAWGSNISNGRLPQSLSRLCHRVQGFSPMCKSATRGMGMGIGIVSCGIMSIDFLLISDMNNDLAEKTCLRCISSESIACSYGNVALVFLMLRELHRATAGAFKRQRPGIRTSLGQYGDLISRSQDSCEHQC